MSNHLEEQTEEPKKTPAVVPQNSIGGTSGVAFGVLCVWLAGYFGVKMSAEVGAVVGSIFFTVGVCIWEMGFIGVFKALIKGRKNV